MPSLRNDRARHINLNKIIWLEFCAAASAMSVYRNRYTKTGKASGNH